MSLRSFGAKVMPRTTTSPSSWARQRRLDNNDAFPFAPGFYGPATLAAEGQRPGRAAGKVALLLRRKRQKSFKKALSAPVRRSFRSQRGEEGLV